MKYYPVQKSYAEDIKQLDRRVVGLQDDIARMFFFKPFPSVQKALDDAIKEKGKDAKVLFLVDGTMTVPELG